MKYLKGPCSHCRSNIEFPAEMVGTVIECPHCGNPTELLLAVPRQEPDVPRRVVVWTGAAVLILGLGLAGALIALHRAQRLVARQKEQSAAIQPVGTPPPPVLTNATPEPSAEEPPPFEVSDITLEKAPGTSLVHAVGTVTNPLDKQRFGVRIRVDLLDSAGQKVGTATDYAQIIEPKAEWRFKALVMASKAVSARVASVKEDQ